MTWRMNVFTTSLTSQMKTSEKDKNKTNKSRKIKAATLSLQLNLGIPELTTLNNETV